METQFWKISTRSKHSGTVCAGKEVDFLPTGVKGWPRFLPALRLLGLRTFFALFARPCEREIL